AFAAALWISYRLPWSVCAALLIALNTANQSAVAQSSLTVQPGFSYPAVAPLSFLAGAGQRIAATGNHLLRPDTNAVYGIFDIRSHNPLFPRRYLRFMQEAGAHIDTFNQYLDPPISHLLDLSSVRYVLSQDAVFSGDDESPPPSS